MARKIVFTVVALLPDEITDAQLLEIASAAVVQVAEPVIDRDTDGNETTAPATITASNVVDVTILGAPRVIA